MREDAEVKRVWRNYQVAWLLGIGLPTIAILCLTIAPVVNPEWPLVLLALWAVYVLGIGCEISDYVKTRNGYIKFRWQR